MSRKSCSFHAAHPGLDDGGLMSTLEFSGVSWEENCRMKRIRQSWSRWMPGDRLGNDESVWKTQQGTLEEPTPGNLGRYSLKWRDERSSLKKVEIGFALKRNYYCNTCSSWLAREEETVYSIVIEFSQSCKKYYQQHTSEIMTLKFMSWVWA